MMTRHHRFARISLAPALVALSVSPRAWAAPAPVAAAVPDPPTSPATADAPAPDNATRANETQANEAQADEAQADEAQADEGGPRNKNRPDRGPDRARREADREKRSQSLRRVMTSLGFGDPALQDEVLRYIAVEVRERGQVRRTAMQIYNVLLDPDKSDEEVRALLNQYKDVIQSDQTRRRQAEEALEERIHFRANPRLEAMLTLFGVIGDASIALPRGR